MRIPSASPVSMTVSLWRNRKLIQVYTTREVLARYRGSYLGLVWTFLNPLLMLSVYTFVFSVVFKARWNQGGESNTEFALVLFAGLLVFNLFSESITRAPSLILTNPNYVKKVVFPLEILPLITLLSGLFHWLISFGIWLIAYSMLVGVPHLTIFYFPLILLPFSLIILGMSWFLASLGVYLRDISQFIGALSTTLLFMSPVFYPTTILPERFRFWLYINPITLVVEQLRDVLFWGKPPNFYLLTLYAAISLLIAWVGFIWFQKTRKGFADVI